MMKAELKYGKQAACSVMLPVWDTSSLSASVINEDVQRESFTFH
jgi:hypothetical protein